MRTEIIEKTKNRLVFKVLFHSSTPKYKNLVKSANLYEISAGLTVSLPAPWTMKESSALARFQNLMRLSTN